MIEKEKHIGEAKMTEQPKRGFKFFLGKEVVKTGHIANGAVTPEKVSEGFRTIISQPAVDIIDRKYEAITNELYSMIRSLQVGGIALSNELGDREDVGITQKVITKAIGKIWEAIEDPSHHVFDFTLTAVPNTSYADSEMQSSITANCTQAISDFDYIRIYVDDVLIAESHDISVFSTVHTFTKTSQVKAVGMILGKVIVKEITVVKELPFFMGSGNVYTDIFNAECHKELIGTLEGDYDVVVKNSGEHILIIIPKSKQGEFRRADMNGLGLKVEIPMTAQVYDDFVFYKSVNTYKAGTYNIDIDINS